MGLSDPFTGDSGTRANPTGMIDHRLGSAFEVVEFVRNNFDKINEVALILGDLSLTRSIKVPVGQAAPPFPIANFKNRLVAVDANGQFLPVRFSINGGGWIDSGGIEHGGKPLKDVLLEKIGQLDEDREELERIALALIAQAEAMAAAAVTTETLDEALAQLVQDHVGLSGAVGQLAQLRAQSTQGVMTRIINEQSERLDGDTALAATFDLLGAKSGDGNAFILDLNTVKVSPTVSLAQRFSFIVAQQGVAFAQIQEERTSRVTEIEAEATARETLGATLTGEYIAAVEEEAVARADADSAEATLREQLAATVVAEGGNLTAAIIDESTARADADEVFAGKFSLLGAVAGDQNSFILNGQSVRVLNGQSETETLETYLARATDDVVAAGGFAADALAYRDDAGDFAEAANQSWLDAQSSAGDALNSEENSAESETNAEGSASAASSSEILSASARDAAQGVANLLLPDRLSVPENFFAVIVGETANAQISGNIQPTSTLHPATAKGTNVSAGTEGVVRQFNVFTNLYSRGWLPVGTGRTFRSSFRSRVIVNGGLDNQTNSGFIYADADGNVIPAGAPAPVQQAAAGWVTVVNTTTSAAILASFPTAAYVRARGFSGRNGGGNSGATWQAAFLRLEDITNEKTATDAASASNTSAGEALAYRNTAGDHASAANQSKIDANTAKGLAEGYRNDAVASRDTAQGHASTATTQAGLAATSAGAASGSALDPTNPGAALQLWSIAQAEMVNPTINLVGHTVVAGRLRMVTTRVNYHPIGRVTIAAGRRYQAHVTVERITAGSEIAGWGGIAELYVSCFNAAGTNLSFTHVGNIGYGVATVGAGPKTFQSTVGLAGSGAAVILPAGTAFARIMVATGNASGAVDLVSAGLVDIEAAQAAAGSASAAVQSASEALASSGTAGGHASTASGHAQTSTTKAGEAAGSATAASNSATTASGHAVAAQSSMTLTASIARGGINPNPIFADFPTVPASGGSVPPGWTNWSSAVSRARGTAPNVEGSPYNFTETVTTGAAGIMQVPLCGPGWHMVEVTISLQSGSLLGAGVHLHPHDVNINGLGGIDIPFNTTPDIAGVVNGNSPPLDKVLRFAKLVLFPATTNRVNLHLMSNWHVLGTLTAKTIRWHKLSVRPASNAEVAGEQSLADVRVLAGAVADSLGRQSAYWQTELAVGGSAATASISVRADTNNPRASAMTMKGSNEAAGNHFLIGGRTFQILTNNGAWHYATWTEETYTAGAYASAQFLSVAECMFGLTDNVSYGSVTTYGFLRYGVYYSGGNAYAYQDSTNGEILGPVKPGVDQYSVEYLNTNGGTILYKRNGKTVVTRTNVGLNRTFRFVFAGASQFAGVENAVFAAAAPSSTSSVSLLAQEITLTNAAGLNAIVALKISGGNATFGGDIYAGGRIIMGNGNVGWEVAVKPKMFTAGDGTVITWPNLGYLPNYQMSPIGLAPLAAGETYNLYLDNLTSSGATARCKIVTPGAMTYREVTVDYANGTIQREMHNGGLPAAANNQYRYQGTYSSQALSVDNGIGGFESFHDVNLGIWAYVNSVWTKIGVHSETFSQLHTGPGQKIVTGSFDFTMTISNVTHFGVSGEAGNGTTNIATDLSKVSWTSAATSSTIRTASPGGETCQLTVIP